eukprot:176836-Prymnesium_polylepis.1
MWARAMASAATRSLAPTRRLALLALLPLGHRLGHRAVERHQLPVGPLLARDRHLAPHRHLLNLAPHAPLLLHERLQPRVERRPVSRALFAAATAAAVRRRRRRARRPFGLVDRLQLQPPPLQVDQLVVHLGALARVLGGRGGLLLAAVPVSYTHLTLPTICSV